MIKACPNGNLFQAMVRHGFIILNLLFPAGQYPAQAVHPAIASLYSPQADFVIDIFFVSGGFFFARMDVWLIVLVFQLTFQPYGVISFARADEPSAWSARLQGIRGIISSLFCPGVHRESVTCYLPCNILKNCHLLNIDNTFWDRLQMLINLSKYKILYTMNSIFIYKFSHEFIGKKPKFSYIYPTYLFFQEIQTWQ